MSFDPQAIKKAHADGAAARMKNLPEMPPANYSKLCKAAWRKGYEEFIDPLLMPVDPQLLVNARNRPDAHTWGVDPIEDCKWLRGPLRDWAHTLDNIYWGRRPPLAPDEAAALRTFIDKNREDLDWLSTYRRRSTGGIPFICVNARKVLGISKAHGDPGPNGRAKEQDGQEQEPLPAGWKPVNGKPGNCWREVFPPGGVAGRVNVFKTPEGWKVRLSMAGGAFEYWREAFPTAEAARNAIGARLNLQRPQLH